MAKRRLRGTASEHRAVARVDYKYARASARDLQRLLAAGRCGDAVAELLLLGETRGAAQANAAWTGKKAKSPVGLMGGKWVERVVACFNRRTKK